MFHYYDKWGILYCSLKQLDMFSSNYSSNIDSTFVFYKGRYSIFQRIFLLRFDFSSKIIFSNFDSKLCTYEGLRRGWIPWILNPWGTLNSRNSEKMWIYQVLRALENLRTHGALGSWRNSHIHTHTWRTIGTDKIPRILRILKKSTVLRAI